ncbi:hypothetical protein SAMN06264365_11486 [Actinoplanes regularis]|uniref:Uncharacterized protein n=1 Tax=Actinoplanes regularis TaxID=52697 RepID=A0A239DV31_9ACTN|nr:hypothetical protein Are01nite_54990 [Actinoplanes regularis]SNS35573.1 hypothetical protein SAMN06264365_11486 [Actinoplanes regularis]
MSHPAALAGVRPSHGRVEVALRVDGDTLTVDAALPDGVTGVLSLPGRPDGELHPGLNQG